MAKREYTTYFEKKPLELVATRNQMLESLQWEMDKFMQIDVLYKTGIVYGNMGRYTYEKIRDNHRMVIKAKHQMKDQPGH